jgi:hypothetical protein
MKRVKSKKVQSKKAGGKKEMTEKEKIAYYLKEIEKI